jgi:mitochondrial fission protein ELM1
MSRTGSVWGLDSGRIGEFLQVEILGRALDLPFERISLSPAGEAVEPLPARPPGLILSFGRDARAALRLADGCEASGLAPRPLTVHLGTPGRTPIDAFDLIIPMPQDDYPTAPNVQFLRLPLNGATLAAVESLQANGSGSCTVIVGGPSRHFRLPAAAVRRLIRFGLRVAAANAETLRVVTSPRTPLATLKQLSKLQARLGFTLVAYGGTPFSQLLQSGLRFVVTGDSASMLAEACRTGKPVWLFPLPRRLTLNDLLQHAADRCFGRRFRQFFVRLGWVGGGTDFRRWHRDLEAQGYIFVAGRASEATLRSARGCRLFDTDLRDCRARILRLLNRASGPGDALRSTV